MHKTIATKDGGINVPLSPEEETKLISEWEKNKLAKEAKEKEEVEKKAAKASVFEKLASNLSAEEKAILKEMVKM